jgi:hypothetical protein
MKIDFTILSFMSTTTAFNGNNARLFRPLQARLPMVRVFSGLVFDKSSKYDTDLERVPGLYALYKRIAIKI